MIASCGVKWSLYMLDMIVCGKFLVCAEIPVLGFNLGLSYGLVVKSLIGFD